MPNQTFVVDPSRLDKQTVLRCLDLIKQFVERSDDPTFTNFGNQLANGIRKVSGNCIPVDSYPLIAIELHAWFQLGHSYKKHFDTQAKLAAYLTDQLGWTVDVNSLNHAILRYKRNPKLKARIDKRVAILRENPSCAYFTL